MELKLLLEPKRMANLIPENKIYFYFLYVIFGIWLISFIFVLIFYHPVILKIIQTYSAVTANINLPTLIIGIILAILITLFVEILYICILTILTKIFLLIFKKQLTIFKIVNLYLYSLIIKLSTGILLGFIFIIALKLIKLSGDTYLLTEKFKGLKAEQFENLIYNITNLISSIIFILFYIYITKISAKNKNLN